MISVISTWSPRFAFRLAALASIVVGLLSRYLFSGSGVANGGIAFGIALPEHIIYLVGAALLGIILYGHEIFSADKPLAALGWGMIFGGGLTNLVERLLAGGYILDYWTINGIGNFNFNDVAIFGGLVLVIIKLWD